VRLLRQRPREEVFPETPAELRAEIFELTAAGGRGTDGGAARRLRSLRNVLGMHLLDAPPAGAGLAAPTFEDLPESDGLPEISRDELTPGLIRAGILRDGCLLVRGLVERSDALHLADAIDRAFEGCDRGAGSDEGYYEEFTPNLRFSAVLGRPWIRRGGGVLAVDSPLVAVEMMELLDGARVPALVEGYLGESALMSAQKTTLRKADPSVPGAWHQDGYFMGDVQPLNLWLSLSRCGDEAPGLDLVPRRLDGLVKPREEGSIIGIEISPEDAKEAAGDRSIMRPIFEPGDALFFDELFLHQTASDPAMQKPRYALESWFFGSSSFPADYAPIAL
jgi:hypothetical protein